MNENRRIIAHHKYKLTWNVLQVIRQCLLLGFTQEETSAMAGISKDTFTRWKLEANKLDVNFVNSLSITYYMTHGNDKDKTNPGDEDIKLGVFKRICEQKHIPTKLAVRQLLLNIARTGDVRALKLCLRLYDDQYANGNSVDAALAEEDEIEEDAMKVLFNFMPSLKEQFNGIKPPSECR